MIGNWQIAHLPESSKFFLYAEAYLHASRDVCRRMEEDISQKSWPNGSVAMMLGAHAVELFLKGAIFICDPSAGARSHCIDQLAKTYFRMYPDDAFLFNIPFIWDLPGLPDDEKTKLKKELGTPSVRFRYPVREPGHEWKGQYGFESRSFLIVLAELEESFSRIKNALGNK